MNKKALVVVLGDLARSPRMQYHCISLAKNDYDVTVIANGGGPSSDKACEKLETNKNIKQKLMPDTVDFKKYLPSLLAYLIRPIWQAILLIIQLLTIPVPDVIIVQNPPSIPTLPIIYMYARLVGSRWIIDWHNYGFSILNLNLRSDHPLVRVYKFIEIFFGRLADAGFCVSEAMQTDLKENFQITYPLCVLYDKPPSHFKPMTVRKKHEFFLKIKDTIPVFKSDTKDWYHRGHDTPAEHRETRFTITYRDPPFHVIPRPNRPAIVLSSTSWTEDEDFDLLLNALRHYDQSVINQFDQDYEHPNTSDNWLPKLVCVITGKGPLKAHYEKKIEKMNFEHIEIILPWLSAEDYCKMVGSCDIGISLHSSSSGVDLPMKVVDLYGCGIPVLAFKYKAINELVVEDFYGRTFRDSQDLFLELTRLLKDFYHQDGPHENSEPSPLDRYRKNITRHFLKSRWETNWKQNAKPLFDRLTTATYC
uniref:Beta-1,4-mannosyltransferase n=1 Tax=Aceria tosichella TaxID=561515 RepID=A0A6G1S6G9_9ACAR